MEWKIIDRVPRIRLLPGERVRDFVRTRKQEEAYLAILPQPLGNLAVLLLDTGLRISEALSLEWSDVHLEPVGSARFGYLLVREGKSRNAKRTESLTGRVRVLLEALKPERGVWVFATERGGHYCGTNLNRLHQNTRETLKLRSDFVLHSLRHTMLSRL